MRYSRIFGNNTLRHNPSSSKSISYSLLLRGGYVRSLGSGLFALMPLGMRVVDKMKNIIREEMDALDGQEMDLPLVVPQNLWRKTGRDQIIGKELIRFVDRHGHDLVLSSSHLEPITQLARLSINSYRDFPRFLYQFKTKFRDEERVRCGLFRAKEFTMKDAYSFHRSYTDLNNFFPKVFRAYRNIFERCGVEVITAKSAVGSLSGDRAYEFLMECDWGDNYIVKCPSCGYQANLDVAKGYKDIHSGIPRRSEEISTPGCDTKEKLMDYLGVEDFEIAVTTLFKTLSGRVLVVCRGDYDISHEKLSRLLEEPVIGPASEEEVRAEGLVPGFLFPSNEITGFKLVVDDAVAESDNLIVGSDKKDIHLKNASFGRDFESSIVGDIVRIRAASECIQCRTPLEEVRAIEVGNIFKLGDFYPKSIGLSFTEENGEVSYPHMGSYGIGLGRLVTAIVEANHDDKGIIWPHGLAPFNFFLMGIGKSFRVKNVVEKLAEEIGSDVLFDDRHESVGVKFKDFDLLGIPYRIVVSTKGLQDGNVEFYERKTGKSWRVPVEMAVKTCRALSKESI
ncbi:MAG: proline--tRNA ligase [Spirochaetales bacterium]|uniref:Proline--tRNA ligase n=1 Tax=Candidatus Thalassospirochaeta sargassi TaxID=3119039 RepID=A0AAJ1IBR6_9SPIO|nr:proline--tRNA ligase [Spirochaetales bacterium]